MVLFTEASEVRHTFVGGKCGLPSALLVGESIWWNFCRFLVIVQLSEGPRVRGMEVGRVNNF